MERSSALVAGAWHGRAPLVLATAIGALAILGLLGATTAAPSGAQTPSEEFFDFEDVEARISGSPATAPIEQNYASRGLIFPTGVTALVFDDTSFPPRPDLPRSPSQVITTCYSQEFCSTRINMAFDPPLERVDLYVGYAQRLLQPADVVLEIFDASGTSLGATRATLGASDVATPADTLLSVTDQPGRIAAAQVRLADEDRFLSSLFVDDLTIVPFVAVAQAELTPDPIELDLTDEAVSTQIQLVNTGNQPLTDLTIEILDVDDAVVDLAASLGSACAPVLAPGDRCPVTLAARPTDAGVVDGALVVRSGGQVLADAGLSIEVDPPAPPPDTTDTTVTTEPPDDTEPEDDTNSTVGSETAGADDGADDGDESDGFPAWLVYLVGGVILGVGGRRALKGRRSSPPEPGPSPEPTTKRPTPPSPEVVIRPDAGRTSIDVDADRALVARTGLATAVLTITDGVEGALENGVAHRTDGADTTDDGGHDDEGTGP